MKKNIVTLLIIGTFTSSALFACRVNVVNDLSAKETIIIGDKEVKELKIVNPNTTQFVGSDHRRPIITLYRKENAKGPFKKMFQIKMIACATTPEVSLKASDIINNSYNKDLFEATPYAGNEHKTLMKATEPMAHK